MSEKWIRICLECHKKFTCEPKNRYASNEPNVKIEDCTIEADNGRCSCDPCFTKKYRGVSSTRCRTVYLEQKPRKGKLIGGAPIQ